MGLHGAPGQQPPLRPAPGQPLPLTLKPQWFPGPPDGARSLPCICSLTSPHLPARMFSAPPSCVCVLVQKVLAVLPEPPPGSQVRAPFLRAVSPSGPPCSVYPGSPAPTPAGRAADLLSRILRAASHPMQTDTPQILQPGLECVSGSSVLSIYDGEAEAQSGVLTRLGSHSRFRRAGPRCPAWASLLSVWTLISNEQLSRPLLGT